MIIGNIHQFQSISHDEQSV